VAYLFRRVTVVDLASWMTSPINITRTPHKPDNGDDGAFEESSEALRNKYCQRRDRETIALKLLPLDYTAGARAQVVQRQSCVAGGYWRVEGVVDGARNIVMRGMGQVNFRHVALTLAKATEFDHSPTTFSILTSSRWQRVV